MRITKFFKDLRRVFRTLKKIESIIDSKLVINKYDYLSMTSKEHGTEQNGKRKDEIVVSLTTYGNRIHEVYLTIESLLHQTVKPDRIILWL